MCLKDQVIWGTDLFLNLPNIHSQTHLPLPSHPCSLCLPVSVGTLPPSGPRSSSSAPPANPPSGLMNPSLPFTSSPDPTPSQNPLSLMMTQMSKYAMPSSTPLYHNAIKTIATSDDELLPDRPLLPPPPPPQGSGPGARIGQGPREASWCGHWERGAQLWLCWLFCASEGPGRGGGGSGMLFPLAGVISETQPRALEWSFQHLVVCLANWARTWSLGF